MHIMSTYEMYTVHDDDDDDNNDNDDCNCNCKGNGIANKKTAFTLSNVILFSVYVMLFSDIFC